MSYGNDCEAQAISSTPRKPCKSDIEEQMKRVVLAAKVDKNLLDAIKAFTAHNGEHAFETLGLDKVLGRVYINHKKIIKRIENLEKQLEIVE